MRLAEAVVVVAAAATPEIADWDWRLLRPQRLQPRLDFGISAVTKKKKNHKYFIKKKFNFGENHFSILIEFVNITERDHE